MGLSRDVRRESDESSSIGKATLSQVQDRSSSGQGARDLRESEAQAGARLIPRVRGCLPF